jgi:hypothetical protein
VTVKVEQTARSHGLRVRVWDRRTYGCDVQLVGQTDRLILIWGRHVISLCHQLSALLDSNTTVRWYGRIVVWWLNRMIGLCYSLGWPGVVFDGVVFGGFWSKTTSLVKA